MFREFKEFAIHGNVVDMAIGIVIGAAFGKIITSLVNDIIMPPVGLILGRVDFNDLFLSLNGTRYASLAAAKAAGAPTLNYGTFLNTVLDFLIVSFCMFVVIRQANRMIPAAPPAPPATRECPYCTSVIPVRASRCPYCTSDVQPAAA